jgi:hypothetical protein
LGGRCAVVTGAALFLASDEASYITGENGWWTAAVWRAEPKRTAAWALDIRSGFPG